MKDLLKLFRKTESADAVSVCAKTLKDLHKLKMTYPPEEISDRAICINLKA